MSQGNHNFVFMVMDVKYASGFSLNQSNTTPLVQEITLLNNSSMRWPESTSLSLIKN